MNIHDMPPGIKQIFIDLLQTREPNYRYFENRKTKEMFCWTVEKVDGKYTCFNYTPAGKGSRSGSPKRWKLTKRIQFSKRKSAKARALKRYEQSLKHGSESQVAP